MKVHVHIERLVLDGLPMANADGPRVGAAVEAGLARLLAAGGLSREFAAGGAVTRLDAPPIALAARPRVDAIGNAVAQSVNTRLGDAKTQAPGAHSHDRGSVP
jgi:hypothetical protein